MESHTIETFLVEHPLFRWLDARYIRMLAGLAKNEVFQDGDEIFRHEENANRFYIVVHGTVTLERRTKDGRSHIVQTIEDGGVFGWTWLFPPYKWHFDAQARAKTSVLCFDARQLREECEKDHELGHELMRRFSSLILDRLHAVERQLWGET